MPTPNYELVETFRIARRPQKRARVPFETLRDLQTKAEEEGVKLKSHAGMVALDTVSAVEMAVLQKRYDRIRKSHVEEAVDAVKRSRSTTIDDYRPFGLKKEVAVFEEGGDLSLGIPFDKATQALVAEEREVLAGCISAAARAAVTLIEPEDGHYLTIAKASVTAASEDIFDELASEAERLLWTPASAGEVVVGASVDMYDTEVYDTYASIRQS